MQKIVSAITACALFAMAQVSRAIEGTWEYAVQVNATAQSSPARITLSWPQDTQTAPTSYVVYRKSPNATSWGTGTTLPGSTTSYTDSNVVLGSTYEYQIVKNTSGYTGYGYVYAGINAPLTESRGKLVLVVDNTYASQLATELARLQQDIVGDGWRVVRVDVNRNDSVASVKAQIKAQYDADPTSVKAVFLFGHVPVPYSGNIVPDGHTPDHQGAWPADAYYGDMNGNWTDNSVNVSGATETRNRNIPGDGKFDQSNLPSDIELQVGRVDLANMPGRTYWGGPATFQSELELLRNYLNKDHNFRHKILTATRRGVVGDYFGIRDGEAFAASGWRNLSAFFGANNVTNLNTKYNDAKGVWIETVRTNDFLWAYGCGAGSYTSIGGLGKTGQYQDIVTTELVGANPKAVFTMLFGSWLGDWDSEDNIMRSVLACKDYGLTCAWSGRPHWFLQHMALGETIGFGARLTQNNRNGLYQTQVNSCAGWIHVALMGDPTLRMHVVAPPSNIIATTNSDSISLSWSASPEAVAGYYVYRASGNDQFTRLTAGLVTGTSYTDSDAATGNYTYMVRAVKLETGGSGSYINASQGIFAGANVLSSGSTSTNPPSSSGGSTSTNDTTSSSTNSASTPTNSTVSSATGTNSTVWVEDALPSGATGNGNVDSWSWVSSNPSPFSGSLAHQSANAAGLHEHYFNFASQKLTPGTGEKLFTYVYLDPANPPTEVMLSWVTSDGSWEHRAYWGANSISSGTDGTASRYRVGNLPAVGQWVRLELPASAVGVEGTAVQGMSFSLYGGKATWDYAGKSSVTTTTNNPPVSGDSNAPTVSITSPANNASVSSTVTVSANAADNVGLAGVQFKLNGANLGSEVTSAPFSTSWSTASAANGSHSLSAVARDAAGNQTTATSVSVIVNNVVSTNPIPTATSNTASVVDYLNLELPKVGDNTLHILAPNLLELKLINTKQTDPARVGQWDFVNNNVFAAPPTSAFTVLVNGQRMLVTSVGFKRRPMYAPFAMRDLRIENSLYLQLGGTISDNQTVEVQNPGGALWASSTRFVATTDPLRYSPAIHVNQEGYLPTHQKKAMVGYYLGNLGEMNISATTFKIVNAQSGAQVFQGSLTSRLDVGYTYSPTPYQKVLEADFSSVTTPGEYRLVVPGMGASLPFLINEGVAMTFARTYALGLYHQRCGTDNAMPYTRFTHNDCHKAAAAVPTPQSSWTYTWGKISGYANSTSADNPPQIAPRLTSEAAQLYPFNRTGTIDVSGGHHDAGDYSKYTANSAQLVHDLMFAADSLPGVGALDNLGIPESGDGVSDVLQEAKWEADFLAKLQDTDGGFYFLVYPQQREYENDKLPDQGDPQLVWPKTTSVTAASVAALAQCASSPKFKAAYPQAAAAYLQKAQLGWQFLTNAINRFGKAGAYQKITHYSDSFTHDDELAWAACEMYLATGNPAYQQQLLAWFDPSSNTTMRWGWWRLYACYGNAIRSYAFAARSGRLTQAQLDPTFLSKCETQITTCGDDTMTWSQQNAYGTSFPPQTKAVKAAGWYFSASQAYDVATAYQINPKPGYLNALLANMNYEGGCNPVNASYVTGLGVKRQREIVHQYAQNDRRILPPSGIPLGNIQVSFDAYLWAYSPGELNNLVFPSDGATTAPYPFYDRWADSYNVMNEFVHTDTARGFGALAYLAAQTSLKTQPWVPVAGQITVASDGTNNVATMTAPGIDLTGARIVWEAQDQEPGFGNPFRFVPKNTGTQWIEAEAQLPDGRRIFATSGFNATAPLTTWIDDALPVGSVPQASGGDSWNWVASPTQSGSLAHQSALANGLHEHFFDWASSTMAVGTGDVLFAWIYLDPVNPPTEVMVSWNDGSWEHRAYWGANTIGYGIDGTASRRNMGLLPAAGQWVRLEVPASQVGLEGKNVRGMSFSLYNGRATWDNVGRMTQTTTNPPSSASVPSTIRFTGNRAVISWSSVSGKVYQVFYKTNLFDPSWTKLSADISGTGSTMFWTDNDSSRTNQRYYQVMTAP